ncbi:MAG: YeeE/YedE family protein [Burkholderiaceae bacterium]|nr:YeeE/YedE family protein [Burkholderiaceae bacterium]
MKLFTALISGLLFGTGLIISGMSNPAKIMAFLDLSGNWDPSLVFVMAGAIAVAAPAFAWAKRRRQTLLNTPLNLPENTAIDKRLVVGSLLFGAGWGLAGFCPGPALVAASSGIPGALLFAAAMLSGMALFTFLPA